MRKCFYLSLCLFPLLAWAVPQNTSPSSGPTDAKRDQNTDIGNISASPINQGAGIQKQQAEEGEGSKKEELEKNFKPGPYDRNGQYLFFDPNERQNP